MMDQNKRFESPLKPTALLSKLKILSVLVMMIMLNACSTIPGAAKVDVKPVIAQQEINEDQLLNVSIKLFKPGELPTNKDEKRGLSKEIRKSEARYMPIHLKYTMQRTGFWGNVRVIPDDNEGSEIIIKGIIINSDGENSELKITVFDASNKKWFEKTYNETVTIAQQKETEIEKKDRFQNIYNKISNDIIEHRLNIKSTEIKRIKEIAEIRFANYMAPEKFTGYIGKDKEGIVHLRKLPANDDSMLTRVRSIKARDDMLVDTINNYYDLYYADMWENYDNWRKFRSEELQNIREIERKATTQKILGAAAILGAIALGASNNSDVRNSTGGLRTVMIAGGGYAVYQGFQTSKESEINKEAIEELGASFEIDVEPILVDVNGKTMTLTGTADQQYGKWRELLKEIHIKETAF
ncbi:MAG: hypothetical protein KZQ64_03910 [gamma proteobacterium symbiont of Bathyaustriella thionipta]|nr:hypothetical protein [gamma proteobacterium symbiont of Bathyaustriella thionipta]MCU7949390.1 hypothetical protein [gamma proteobacterium symbiont of Bathyaustriella thionipta]MCU7952526.1 hypothetical protein [gamma proteobacterium symbiont of Bathyaustriella thionipta]MCU7955966.1 hypothetical protein [gamma proteobacterium symbiont of Bathyaustriella thionipta]MCU7968427.1 hypothetical protein [gamma proteobacterium symbiont of Bathyaustriella thionipta]